jgi:hypothetical protein
MRFGILMAAIAILLFVALVAAQEVGRRFGRARCSREGDKLTGLGDVDAGVFALLSLLIAFAFDGAATRFDHRRDLVTEELNAIDSAYQQLALLPAGPRATIRAQLRSYLAARIETYRAMPDLDAAYASLARSQTLQDEIWTELVPVARAEGDAATIVVLPAVNEMFDAATTRTMAIQMHPPAVVFVMLGGVALLSALLAGYGMGAFSGRPIVHMLIYAGTLALAIYVILELEFPQAGWVKVDNADQNLVHLLERMK